MTAKDRLRTWVLENGRTLDGVERALTSGGLVIADRRENRCDTAEHQDGANLLA